MDLHNDVRVHVVCTPHSKLTLCGAGCHTLYNSVSHPTKTIQARILNPLLPMDFHNDVRVHVVPETEEFIASIGHMASEEDIAYLQSGREVQLYSKDFVDPGLVFQATGESES